MSHIANKIDAEDKNLSELLHNKRFRIDVFQREYKWGKKQMEDLINDVTGSFLKCYSPSDDLSAYDSYDCYYMGPVVLCQTNRDTSIIDGQQRLTSFSLILIYLSHLAKELNLPVDEMRDLKDYIFVRKGGTKTLVLNIEQRASVMSRLTEATSSEDFTADIENSESSCRNILERYMDIREFFPEELMQPKVLQVFIDWLLDKVVFVQINAYSMDNAYTIFETMNDRGLNLSPAEILKGFLLSKIIEGQEDNNQKADVANNFWNECISSLHKTLDYDNSDLDFFKAWFRAKYAETKRQAKAGSENEDFELIGSQFHSWVKNNTARMGLRTNDDFFYFIKSDLEFYSNQYRRVFSLKQESHAGFESIYNNSFFTIADSLYYPLMLAAVSKIDTEEDINQKLSIVGRFIERYSNLRLLQNKSISQTVIRNNIYDLVKTIRNLDKENLRKVLSEELSKISSQFNKPAFPINSWQYMKYLMGYVMHRAYSETGIDAPLEYYMPSRKKNSFALCLIQDEDTDQYKAWLDDSKIANCVLIRKADIEQYRKIDIVSKRVNFLMKHGYAPEVPTTITNTEDFFKLRHNKFIEIIQSLFFDPL